jgi:hypothetical protein
VVAGSIVVGAMPGCTVRTQPTAGVRANLRGDAVIVAPRCTDERIEAVQVADLDGPVRWRAEAAGGPSATIFTVGGEPPSMRETDPLEGRLDPARPYVATVEYAGTIADVDVEFHPSSLRADRVVTADGEVLTLPAFAEASDLECVGGWLWVFGGIAIALIVLVVAALAAGVWVIVRVVRTARRQREAGAVPDRPDLSGR